MTALVLCAGCASVPRLPSLGVATAKVSGRPLPKKEAEEALKRADAARDEAQCEQAITLWKNGKTAEARQLLNEVRARNPLQPQARRLLADLAIEQGDAEQAEKLLLDLLNEHPTDQAARASLAWLYESLGRQREAKELFQQLDASFSPAT
jgi:predicted Zn-dependent protease